MAITAIAELLVSVLLDCVDECCLQSVMANLYNKTMILESQLSGLQQKWTSGEGLPPAVHAAIKVAVDSEVRYCIICVCTYCIH